MKNKLSLFATVLLFTYMCLIIPASRAYADSSDDPVPTAPDVTAGVVTPGAPPITAESGIVADADTGRIYYQKDMHKQMYPASLTKILTGIIAVEDGHDGDEITVPDDILAGMPSDAARIDLEGGEQITQEEALYTMFLASANDSANALALHIGGTLGHFVTLMNARAKALGAVDSHFSNANGLPDEKNVSSAYDMALITKKALSEPALMKYFGATSYVMPATNKRDKPVTYTTLHKMMKDTVYKYDGVIAGKTGWETMSGHTLVTAARRNGHTIICVVMKSSNASSVYRDSVALLDYGFSQAEIAGGDGTGDYLKVPVAASVKAKPAKPPKPPAPKPKPADDPTPNRAVPIAAACCAAAILMFVLLRRRARTRRVLPFFRPAAERRRYKA